MSKNMVYQLLKIISRVAFFIGAFVGVSVIHHASNIPYGVRLFALIAIVPLSFCSFFTHTVFAGRIYSESSHFFEYEAGGTNLAVAISLFVAMLLGFELSAIVSILMLYWIYLFVAGVTHFIFNGYKKFLVFLPMLIVLMYFIIMGLVFLFRQAA